MKTGKAVTILFFSVLLFWGCEDVLKPDPDIIPDPTFVTITAFAGPGGVITPQGIDTVPALSVKVYTYTVTPSTDSIISSVMVNDNSQLILNHKEFKYDFRNLSSNCEIKAEFKDAKYLLLIKSPWYLQNSYTYENGAWKLLIPDSQKIFTVHTVYTLDGFAIKYDGESIYGGPYPYSMNGNVLKVYTSEMNIDVLNNDSLVLSSTNPIIKEIYTHTPKKL